MYFFSAHEADNKENESRYYKVFKWHFYNRLIVVNYFFLSISKSSVVQGVT